MSTITAVITSCDYARFLPYAVASAESFADEVLIFDDGSSDGSQDVIRALGHYAEFRDTPSGDPVWGSNRGIDLAKCDYIHYLDADNFMVARPQPLSCDYHFGDITIVDEAGTPTDTWRYGDWPASWRLALERCVVGGEIPVPWGGFWRTGFLRDNALRWTRWPNTHHAADYKTCIEWLKARPSIGRLDHPCLAFRQHPAQESEKADQRAIMREDARVYRGELAGWLALQPR